MNAQKLAKIKAIADDMRGHPEVRRVAQEMYRRYAAEAEAKPKPKPFRDTRHEGMKTSAAYDRYMFMDLGSWRRAAATGNPFFHATHNGRPYFFVIFKHKKTPTYGWVRTDETTKETVFSGRFATMAEAHEDAWKTLQAIRTSSSN